LYNVATLPREVQKVIFQRCYSYVLLNIQVRLILQSPNTWTLDSPELNYGLSHLGYHGWACTPEYVDCGRVAAAAGWDMDWIPAEHRGSSDRTVAVAVAVCLHENKILTINEYKQKYRIHHANKVLYEVETYKTRTLFTDWDYSSTVYMYYII